jgi:hypothetical protein
MKTALLVKILLYAGFFVQAQVGINTNTPQATLDVNGKPTDNTTLDGIIPPRITGDQLHAKTYTGSQTGALVYVTAADTSPSGQTIDVTAIGNYYFDGTKWIPSRSSSSANIYNSNGLLTDDRSLEINEKCLTFYGTDEYTTWNYYGGLSQIGKDDSASKSANITLRSPDNDSNGTDSSLGIQTYPETAAQILAGNDATALNIGTNSTTNPASLVFVTSSGGKTSGTPKAYITGGGNMGIATDVPTEKLDIAGNTRIQNLPLHGTSNAINTTPSGDLSNLQDQPFVATKTVVADANGVLGYVDGPPFYQNIRGTVNTVTGGYTITPTDYLIVTNVASGGSTITFPNLTPADTGRTVQIFNNNPSGAANNIIGTTTILGQVGNNAQRGRTLVWSGSVWMSIGL